MSGKKKGKGKGKGKSKEAKPKKVVVDRTFGLKNKNKSKKVQQFVKQVQQGQAHAGLSREEQRRREQLKLQREARKAEKAMKQQDRAVLKPIVPSGGGGGGGGGGAAAANDGVCKFFLQGACARGNKCKFSHTVSGRQQKLNLYVDPREADTMDNWDQAKLEQVVNEKDRQAKRRPNQTEIVCKYFLEAIEKSKYGHFWKCPNGDGCIYRHRLPQGFVFRPKGQKMEEEIEDEVPLEEQIEEARAKLDPDKCTPVTEASFKAWLAKQEQKKKEEVEKVRKKAAKKGGNRGIHALSGHALFQFDQSLFQQQLNDDEAVAEYKISEIDNRDTDDEEEEPKQASSKKKKSSKKEEQVDGAINADVFLSAALDDLDLK